MYQPLHMSWYMALSLISVYCFTTGYFWKTKDSNNHRSGISSSTSMQGIALGHCRKMDGMIFCSPHSKEVYIPSDYKLDEGRHTRFLQS